MRLKAWDGVPSCLLSISLRSVAQLAEDEDETSLVLRKAGISNIHEGRLVQNSAKKLGVE